ncbi:MAG: chemotaxis protein CheW [Gammaproteobacteria bacterium]|nr:chemotaxis protein CheW [Gammaproteobacteria bacterium]MDH5660072.1 chemotaxis protein CheW [Gammaproteobacteria bacterium]
MNNSEGNQQSLLTFRVGPVLCCAPSLPVKSIITPPKLTHPPGSDTSQPGIFKHGTHIVRVLDLRKKFGVDSSEQTQPGNLIITIFKNESFAFWVDQILDVFDFPSEGWGNLPAAIPRGAFSRTLLLNKKIHLYSEFEKLATINDLGYLVHYIQQLNQLDSEKTVNKNTIAATTSKSLHLNKENISNDTSVANDSSKPALDIKLNNVKNEKPVATTQLSSANNTKQKIVTTQISSNTITSKKGEMHSYSKTIGNVVNKSLNTASVTANLISTEKKPSIVKELKPSTYIGSKIEGKSVTSQTTSSIQLTDKDESESYIGIIFSFIFLLAGLGAGLYYLLYEGHTQKNYKYKKEQTVNMAEFSDKTNETYISQVFTSPEQAYSHLDKSDTVSDSNIDNDIIGNIPNEENKSAINNDYQAEITQSNDEITITIQETISNNQLQQTEEPITSQPAIKDEKIIDTPPVNILNEDKLAETIKAEKVITEIVHIVVIGDTLWAIAKKHVHNPFLYPELARLSKIKNPHRIYPGNRVRIRFIKN